MLEISFVGKPTNHSCFNNTHFFQKAIAKLAVLCYNKNVYYE